VKVCCISSVEEARIAVRHGADALGLVSRMPSGPGVIDEELITEIVRHTPPPVATFLLTSSTSADELIEQQRRTGASTLQLVDHVPFSELQRIRKALHGTRLVQVIHVLGEASVVEALEASAHVDALLLDSGNPTLAVKELGGTGRVHDWQVSRTICERAPVPVFLAGGLKAENVGEAIRGVRPYGLDICSGLRTDGKLDEAKVARFFQHIAQA
jgi:phosphoribosylanthranilate isomerase